MKKTEADLNPIGKLSKEYSKKPGIQALLQLVPGWGSVDTLMKHRAEEIRMDRLRTFFDELANGDIELTEELISKEDFLHFYFATLRAAINTRQREKIRMLARFLLSGLRDNFEPSADEYEELLDILGTITIREFGVLYDLYNYEKSYPKSATENELQNATRYWPQAIAEITKKYDIPQDSFEAFLAKIERTGLYLRITGGFMNYSGNIGKTTTLFRRLLEFVKKESNGSGTSLAVPAS